MALKELEQEGYGVWGNKVNLGRHVWGKSSEITSSLGIQVYFLWILTFP
jgi:hypothetical protein